MRKLLLPTALTLATLGSLAFYTKAAPRATKAEASPQYLVVMGTSRPGGIGTNITEVLTILPDGQQQVQPVDTRGNRGPGGASVLLRRAELARVNQLGAEGWHLISAMQNVQSSSVETTYVLEKR